MRGMVPALGCAGVILLLSTVGEASATVADAVVIGRRASSPPVAAVEDLAFDAAVEQQLNWTMYVNGDYDQNGEVNISDVTVIGQKYGATSAHLDWHNARVADGDGNGEVNISDLTPIGNNFGSRVSHFVLYSSADLTGPFEIAGTDQPVALATTEFASAAIPAGGGPRRFSHSIAYPIPGQYYCVVAYDGAAPAAVHSNVLLFDPLNLPPVAVFGVYPSGEKMTGVAVRLEASASFDPDGSITKFEWDMLADGSWMDVGTDTVVQYQYMLPGEYTPILRVTDNQGATCVTSYDEPQLYVSTGVIRTAVVDTDPQAGIQLSCALVDGRPAIAYVQYDGDYELRYLRAGGAGELSWPSPVLVDTGSSQPSLADLFGLPAIAYSKDELNYILGNDADGSSWILPVSVATDPGPFAFRGFHPDLATGLGKPLIADSTFQPTVPGHVWVTQPQDDLGVIWGWESQVSTPGSTGFMPSLAVLDAAYASVIYQRYINSNTYDIYYLSSLAADLTQGWYTPQHLSPENARLSSDCSIIAADPAWGPPQLPLVAFWDADNGVLRSVGVTDRTELGTLILADVAESSGTNANFSLAKIDAQPAVAYFDGATKELKLSWAADRMAFGWGEPIVLDSGAVFHNPSLIEYNYWPAVAYYDADAEVLKFCYVTPE